MDGHLEMAWDSLILAKKEISTMKDKFYEVQEVNQEMKESVAECRSELRDLSAAVNKLVKENVGQKKFNQVITEKIKTGEAKIPQRTTSIRSLPHSITREYAQITKGSSPQIVNGGLATTERLTIANDALEAPTKRMQSYQLLRRNITD